MKRIGIIILAVTIVAAAFLIYLFNGFTDKKSIIEYEVNIQEFAATNRVNVVMTVYPKRQLFLHLYMKNTAAKSQMRVDNFQVQKGKVDVNSWQTIPWFKDMKSIWLGFDNSPITISYSVDPTWYKDSILRSHVSADYAFLKGMSFLFIPLTSSDTWALMRREASRNNSAGLATIEFRLPEGWTVNSPWGTGKQQIPASYLGYVYFGMGDISMYTKSLINEKNIVITGKDIPISIGIYNKMESSERSKIIKYIPDLYKEMYKALGFFPKSQADYWAVTVLPDAAIQEGIPGTGSLIAGSDVTAISRGMFHWWNGSAIQVFEDAAWIREGFTEYYSGKMLNRAGIWSSGEFTESIKGYSDKLWSQGANTQVINLVNASKRLAAEESQDDHNAVFYGGALVAYYLDTELQKMEIPLTEEQKKDKNTQKQFKSLDMVWETISDSGLLLTTDKFISVIEEVGGKELSKECSDIVYGRKPIKLPQEK